MATTQETVWVVLKLCDIPAKFVEKFCFLSKFDCCCGLIRLKTKALLSVNLKDLSWDSSISNPGLSWLLVSGMGAKKWPQGEWINQFLDWLIGRTMDSTQKVWFSEGIDRCFNYCFFFFFFAWKFSIVNCLSMRGKHPSKAAACCNGGKLFFMERWIAVVPARDVQVQINHFI